MSFRRNWMPGARYSFSLFSWKTQFVLCCASVPHSFFLHFLLLREGEIFQHIFMYGFIVYVYFSLLLRTHSLCFRAPFFVGCHAFSTWNRSCWCCKLITMLCYVYSTKFASIYNFVITRHPTTSCKAMKKNISLKISVSVMKYRFAMLQKCLEFIVYGAQYIQESFAKYLHMNFSPKYSAAQKFRPKPQTNWYFSPYPKHQPNSFHIEWCSRFLFCSACINILWQKNHPVFALRPSQVLFGIQLVRTIFKHQTKHLTC